MTGICSFCPILVTLKLLQQRYLPSEYPQPDFPMLIIALRIGFVSREKENLCLNQNVNYMRHADGETERETASPVQNRTGGLRNFVSANY